MSNRILAGLVLGVGVGFAALAAAYLVSRVGGGDSPEAIAEEFFRDTYRQDFASAWERVSAEDQEALSKEEYLASNPLPTVAQAALLDQLAEWGEFETVMVASTNPARTFVSAHVRFPHSGQQEVEELLALADKGDAELSALLQQLTEIKDSDQLQLFEGEVTFDLVSQDGRWRLAQHWGQTVKVQFESAVSPDLPWDFYPSVDQISVLPGEMASTSYFVRNNSNEAITGKAVHRIGPPHSAPYFQLIQCFCFQEQTLEPGEEREMVLLFSIDFTAPSEVAEIKALYTFYSLESYPAES